MSEHTIEQVIETLAKISEVLEEHNQTLKNHSLEIIDLYERVTKLEPRE